MPTHVVASAAAALERRGKRLQGASVLVLGVACKRDVDDLRESPSLMIIKSLQEQGADVSYNDPFFPIGGTGAEIQSEHGVAAAGEPWRLRLCADRHRSYFLRLRPHRQRSAAGSRLAQCHPRPGLRKNRTLLRKGMCSSAN